MMNENKINFDRRVYKSSYQRMIRHAVDDYLGTEIYIGESVRKLPPTKEDIEDVLFLLNDMGMIVKNVPVFNTYSELNQWKRQNINNQLS